jgi:23S rRNA (guanosine2251-2'-O)-methyltransferase
MIVLTSINSIRESLRVGNVSQLYYLASKEGSFLVVEAKKAGIPVKLASAQELDTLSRANKHQGIVALSAEKEPCSVHDIIAKAPGKPLPLVLILDGIQDPHNLGAVLRVCDAFGVDGLIVKSKGEVPLNATVARVSTGAIEYVDVAVVPNLNQAISELRDAGYGVVAAEGSAEKNVESVDYRRPMALVIGSEGFGISHAVLSKCDEIVKIPMHGHVNSLNASVSAGIVISQIDLLRRL